MPWFVATLFIQRFVSFGKMAFFECRFLVTYYRASLLNARPGSTSLMWVPGHKWVSGNQVADTEAKTAATSDPSSPINMNFRVPSSGAVLAFVVCQNVLCHINWPWVWFIKETNLARYCVWSFSANFYTYTIFVIRQYWEDAFLYLHFSLLSPVPLSKQAYLTTNPVVWRCCAISLTTMWQWDV